MISSSSTYRVQLAIGSKGDSNDIYHYIFWDLLCQSIPTENRIFLRVNPW